LIKGGKVIDPSQDLNAVRDVALSGDKVAAIETGIPESQAMEVLDAGGLIVVPSLLDLHVHSFWGVTHYGVDPDVAQISKGVTTALDAGSAGADTSRPSASTSLSAVGPGFLPC
jgi:dihydroorotase